MTYRSQVLSRVFASLLIATACDALGLFTRRLAAALPLAALGVGFGTHAGLESQDFHLSLWRRHRDELRSIVGQVPALSEPLPGGEPPRLLLYAPGGAPFLATHYPEVGRPWLNYLYEKRVRLAPWNVAARRYACLAQPGRFVCRDAALEACYATGACRPDELPFDRTVLLTYSLEERRYVLRHELPPDLTGGLDGVGYAPLAHIVPGPRTRTMRELLDAPELLASFFPERRTDGRARGPSRAKGE
jgi:hypothetical protein